MVILKNLTTTTNNEQNGVKRLHIDKVYNGLIPDKERNILSNISLDNMEEIDSDVDQKLNELLDELVEIILKIASNHYLLPK